MKLLFTTTTKKVAPPAYTKSSSSDIQKSLSPLSSSSPLPSPSQSESSLTSQEKRTLDTYSKYTEPFSNRDSNRHIENITYFSRTTMFGRVQSGVFGCSSCGLQKGAK